MTNEKFNTENFDNWIDAQESEFIPPEESVYKLKDLALWYHKALLEEEEYDAQYAMELVMKIVYGEDYFEKLYDK